ncbi:MAG: response regulator transcription factor [Planctomycetota bacterium]
MSRASILLVEDEADVRFGLRTVLETEGFEVHEAEDGDRALSLAGELSPQLMILDLMIPKRDGFEVCRELRSRGSKMPVLILTARDSEVDKVLGLELGADDYVTKPFSVREVVARVRALLRRLGDLPGSVGTTLRIGEVEIDLERARLRRGDAEEPLYHYEREILKRLLAAHGEPVSRNELLNDIWGLDSFPTTRTVDYHVCNLRKKIEAEASEPRHLLTVHGVGYRLVR